MISQELNYKIVTTCISEIRHFHNEILLDGHVYLLQEKNKDRFIQVNENIK